MQVRPGLLGLQVASHVTGWSSPGRLRDRQVSRSYHRRIVVGRSFIQSQVWGTSTPSSSHRLPRISRKSGADVMVQEGCGRTREGGVGPGRAICEREGWGGEMDVKTFHPSSSHGRGIEKDASPTPPLHTMKSVPLLRRRWFGGFLLRVNKSSGFDGYYCMTTNRDRCLVSNSGTGESGGTGRPSSSRHASCSRSEPGGGPGGGL